MSKKILIAGGTGLIGKQLVRQLAEKGYHIHILSRSRRANTPTVTYFTWDFDTMNIENGAVEVDHIINLTGAGIADGRWTEKQKKVLVESRVKAAQLIKKVLKQSGHKPKSYISASAVGYYGSRGDELLTEASKAGTGFMAECCESWEAAAMGLTDYVERLVIKRIGIVLSKNGGALPKILMTKPVYSYFGDGSQYYAWAHIDDICKIFVEAVEIYSRHGIYNAVAPVAQTNKEFTIEIKEALGGIALLPAPTFALRLAMGEMANVVLNSTNVIPHRLEAEGYKWLYPDLTAAVKDIEERKV